MNSIKRRLLFERLVKTATYLGVNDADEEHIATINDAMDTISLYEIDIKVLQKKVRCLEQIK